MQAQRLLVALETGIREIPYLQQATYFYTNGQGEAGLQHGAPVGLIDNSDTPRFWGMFMNLGPSPHQIQKWHPCSRGPLLHHQHLEL